MGVAILSASWMLGLNYYHVANWTLWLIAVVLATGLMIGIRIPTPRRYIALAAAVVFLPMIAVAPWPYRAAPLLIVPGLLLLITPIPRQWPGRLGSGLLVAGVVLLGQSIAMICYESFTARFQDLPGPLSQLLGGVAGLVGFEASSYGSDLSLFTMRQVHRVGATWGLLLDPMSWCFIVGGVALVLLRSSGARPEVLAKRAAWFLVPVVLWLPVRSALAVAIYIHRAMLTGYDDPLNVLVDQFWNPWILAMLLAGPVLLAWRFARFEPGGKPGNAKQDAALPPPAEWKRYVPAAMVLAGLIALTFAAGWEPVGRRKNGRILVDDYHSLKPWPGKTYDTTRTNTKFTTKSYGQAAAYNHSCLFDYCSRFYTMSRRTEGRLTRDALKGCDVLVLKVPSEEYTQAEIDHVLEFVRGGGGLLLLGEHTSVFGSGVYLNRIAEHFGFRFRYDCAFGVDSVFDQLYKPPLLAHPIVQHISEMDFATSCTIEPGLSGRAVIRDTGLKNLPAEYHVSNFYPPARDRCDMRYGAFVQLLTSRYGKGRVAAFTDSTIFSNFCVFEPGKSDVMIGMLEWLNHEGGVVPAPWLAVLGVALLIGSVAMGYVWRSEWPLVLAAGALGWTLSVPAVRALNQTAMPRPEAVRPMIRVGIDRTICDAKLPKNGFIAGHTTDFGQFERSILKLGYFTFRASGEGLTDSNVIVFLNPHLSIPPAFKEKLKRFVAGGGKLLVMDSPKNAKSTASRLLQPFKLKIRPSYVPLSGKIDVPPGWPAPTIKNSHTVEGGKPLAKLKGRTIAARAKYGEGEVWALGFSTRFTDNRMGFIADVTPTGELLPVFEFVYTLLRRVAEGAEPTTTAPAPASRPAPRSQPARR